MAYLPGGSIEDRLEREGRIGWHETVEIGLKVASALEFAHHAGVLHRDVKPANVFVSDLGELQLGDFGIARIAAAGGVSRQGIAGTPAYMPPETLAGERYTVASDVYSMACTLHTMLAGRSPFVEHEDDNVFPIINRILNAPVPDLRPLGVPDPICRVLEQAMDEDPARRPQSCAAFAAMLREARDIAFHDLET